MRSRIIALLGGGLLLTTSAAAQDKKYDPGASDTEILLGQSAPFSGPASHTSTLLALRADRRLARTDPAEPPPTMT